MPTSNDMRCTSRWPAVPERRRRRWPRQLLAAGSAWLCTAAFALPPAVDFVRVDPVTGQMALCIVLDERMDNRQAIDRLRHKLNASARYAQSGEAYAEHPAANRALPFTLTAIATDPIDTIERQNLDGIKLQYRYTPIRFTVEMAEPGSLRRRAR